MISCTMSYAADCWYVVPCHQRTCLYQVARSTQQLPCYTHTHTQLLTVIAPGQLHDFDATKLLHAGVIA